MYRLKSFAKKILPPKIWNLLSFVLNPREAIKSVYYYYLIKTTPKRHKRALEVIRKKDKIKVAFFLIHESVWKYEGVYKLMEQDERFDPIVIVCPYIVYGEEHMLRDMNQAYHSFLEKGYNVIRTLSDNDNWLDVKKEVRPDIVFFTNPHNLTKKEYYITNYLDILTCYVPYAFVVIHSISMHYNQSFHHFLWKHFVETEFHRDYANKYLKNKTTSIQITGYPGLDKIFINDYTPSNVWKNFSNNKTKKIIWAPHHTIKGQGGGLDYSSFLTFSEYFIELLSTNSNIQMAFKPHPLLKAKLYKNKDWGKVKTDDYYQKWTELPNAQLEEGGYIDLFYTSDAMILDSASFIVEYLYFNKPLCFTMVDKDVKDRFNSFGRLIFNYIYTASKGNDVFSFINAIVLNGNDYLAENRQKFFKESILPKTGKTASENIFSEILKEL